MTLANRSSDRVRQNGLSLIALTARIAVRHSFRKLRGNRPASHARVDGEPMNALDVELFAALIAHVLIWNRHRKIGARWADTYKNRVLVIAWIAGNFVLSIGLWLCVLLSVPGDLFTIFMAAFNLNLVWLWFIH
jgi:hypothetical protein